MYTRVFITNSRNIHITSTTTATPRRWSFSHQNTHARSEKTRAAQSVSRRKKSSAPAATDFLLPLYPSAQHNAPCGDKNNRSQNRPRRITPSVRLCPRARTPLFRPRISRAGIVRGVSIFGVEESTRERSYTEHPSFWKRSVCMCARHFRACSHAKFERFCRDWFSYIYVGWLGETTHIYTRDFPDRIKWLNAVRFGL